MDSKDFAAARGALTQSLATFAPLAEALQKAVVVFDAMANAEAHKASLERDVVALSNKVDEGNSQLKHVVTQINERTASLDTVAAECGRKIEEAKAAAEAAVAAATDAMTVQIAEAQVEATERLQAIAKVRQEAEAEHEGVMADMAAQKAAMESDIAALEKKMASVKASAQKFADALKE